MVHGSGRVGRGDAARVRGTGQALRAPERTRADPSAARRRGRAIERHRDPGPGDRAAAPTAGGDLGAAHGSADREDPRRHRPRLHPFRRGREALWARGRGRDRPQAPRGGRGEGAHRVDVPPRRHRLTGWLSDQPVRGSVALGFAERDELLERLACGGRAGMERVPQVVRLRDHHRVQERACDVQATDAGVPLLRDAEDARRQLEDGARPAVTLVLRAEVGHDERARELSDRLAEPFRAA